MQSVYQDIITELVTAGNRSPSSYFAAATDSTYQILSQNQIAYIHQTNTGVYELIRDVIQCKHIANMNPANGVAPRQLNIVGSRVMLVNEIVPLLYGIHADMILETYGFCFVSFTIEDTLQKV